jgi:hypothetical protein
VRGGLGRVLARWDARLLILAEAVLRMVSLAQWERSREDPVVRRRID